MKACPFCGSMSVRVKTRRPSQKKHATLHERAKAVDSAFVRCLECQSCGPAAILKGPGDWDGTLGRAAALWNERRAL